MLDAFGSFGYTLFAFILVVGIMIFVHEFGHYIVAKLLKIRVEVFSLGFGPRLFGFQRGGTDYRVSAIPLGGYVKMAGEHYDEQLTGSSDEFLSRPKFQRFLVAVAGPTMNLLLAVLLLTISYMHGVSVPKYLKEPPVIGEVAAGSPAESAGIRANDRIVKIDNKLTPVWEDVELNIAASGRRKLVLTIERNGELIRKEVVPIVKGDEDIGYIGIGPIVRSIVADVEKGSPAEKAGLQRGDVILQARRGNRVARTSNQVIKLINESEGEPVEFTIERGGLVFTKVITPMRMGDRARIGYAPQVPTITERYGLFEAFRRSIERNYKFARLTLEIVGSLITGRTSLKSLQGPIQIAQFSGRAARAGLEALLGFMALVSLQLGIFNLFPIPILDGGVIFLMLIEGIRRRDFSISAKERITQIGFIFLALLMGIVIFNDIQKVIRILR